MKPPEKIFAMFDTSGERGYFDVEKPKISCRIYHLAPVWHDAVKEPPKERNTYLVNSIWEGGSEIVRSFFDDGKWTETENPDYVGDEIKVTHWMPLPLPPERRGE